MLGRLLGWLWGRSGTVGLTFIHRVRVENMTEHFDAARLEIYFRGGRYVGHAIVPGDPLDLLRGVEVNGR